MTHPCLATTKNLEEYLKFVNTVGCPGLIDQAREWVLDGWEIADDEPSIEQLAAAMLMEAKTQDQCVKDGDSVAEFPETLRIVAHRILRLSGQGDPLLLRSCNENIELGNKFERGGNSSGCAVLRMVGNMLGAMYTGELEIGAFYHVSDAKPEKPVANATHICIMPDGKEYRTPCEYDARTQDAMIKTSVMGDVFEKAAKEFVELQDGTRLSEEDGVTFIW